MATNLCLCFRRYVCGESNRFSWKHVDLLIWSSQTRLNGHRMFLEFKTIVSLCAIWFGAIFVANDISLVSKKHVIRTGFFSHTPERMQFEKWILLISANFDVLCSLLLRRCSSISFFPHLKLRNSKFHKLYNDFGVQLQQWKRFIFVRLELANFLCHVLIRYYFGGDFFFVPSTEHVYLRVCLHF